jgi:hypothetical protein
MSALNRTPENTNLLQPTKFLLAFDRIGASQFFCQTVNIPGISMGEAKINTPMLDVYAPGNKLTYDELSITFLVDEKLQSWQDLHSWFRAMASPEGFSERNRLSEIQNQYTKTMKKSYSDATLTVLSNLNNPTLRVQFFNVFPISLSSIQFDTKESADNIITADATFRFDYFNFLSS